MAEEKFRIESDLLGELKVPADVYYGVQTQRALNNYHISRKKMCDYPDYVIAIAYVKLAAVQTNHALGTINDEIAGAISQACREIIDGKFHENFPVDMMQGGAGILSGKYNPSGRLPMTFPYTTGQIPIYYNRRSPARRGTQGWYKDIQIEPMYEFGYGLSYSEFEYSPITLSADRVAKDGKVTATVTVKNTSDVDGMETVQWYICDPVCVQFLFCFMGFRLLLR